MTTATEEQTEEQTEETTSNDAGSANDSNVDKPVTLTQAELDKKINAASAKAKSVSERDFKKWLETQALSEADKAKVEKEAADKERDEARAELLVGRIETAAERAALTAGVKPDRVEKFLRLVDLDTDALSDDGKPDKDAIKALIEAELEDSPEFKVADGGTTTETKRKRSGGEHNSGSGDTKIFTRAEIKAMTPAEFAKNEAAIDKQMADGLIK